MSENNEAGKGFEALLNDLDELRKSQEAGGSVLGAGQGEGGELGELGKSFSLTLENGEELEAMDGTELVKSLMTRIDSNEATFKEQVELMSKSMTVAVDLIKSQGAQIAELTKSMNAFGATGTGRKTTLSIAEKPAAGEVLQKSEEVTSMPGHEFLAKAEGAMRSGRISGMQLAIAEGALNRGEAVPAHIVDAVVKA